MPTRPPCSDRATPSGRGEPVPPSNRTRGRLIVLEGMPGAGKTTTAQHLDQHGWTVLGEYTTPAGRTLALHDHPAVADDDAHQRNWLTKSAHAQPALHAGHTVISDRDWLSSLAYAYALAHRDEGRLLASRLCWAEQHLTTGALLPGDLYLIYHLDIEESLRRRPFRRPAHPWSAPDVLHALQAFYADPIALLAGLHPPVAALLARARWHHHSGHQTPATAVAQVTALAVVS